MQGRLLAGWHKALDRAKEWDERSENP